MSSTEPIPMVAHRARIFASDEELGKRDDDHVPGKMTTPWNFRHRTATPWLRKRRLFGALIACIFVYVFVHNIPTGLPPQPRPRWPDTRPRPPMPNPIQNPSVLDFPKDGIDRPPARESTESASTPAAAEISKTGGSSHEYDGPVKLLHLAQSLRTLPYMDLGIEISTNVLFAASNLNCAASIIPLACEMARLKVNKVHMVIMGRDEMEIDEIKKINGVDDKVCNIHWHDGRPDSASISTDRRMGISVAGALGYIASAAKPQAIVVSGPNDEDKFFSESMQWKSNSVNIPLIEVPKASSEKLSWLTRLSAKALNAWHKASIDILIQVSRGESGSLVRLLRSLQMADYSGFVHPRLTIELPHKLDDATNGFLHYFFHWPPKSMKGSPGPSLLTLRRRIPDKRLDPDTAALRFLESFYPTNTDGPSVLILSPQAEVSPVYYQYLKMQLLEYQYSTGTHWSQKLLGISLETPSEHLNGSAAFEKPQKLKETDSSPSSPPSQLSPFLWQAPNSNAALYFGHKWRELHSFLTNREAAVFDSRTKTHHQNRPKTISRRRPAWAEFVLDLMRARGYTFLYPMFPRASEGTSRDAAKAENLVVIHNDLYTPPEEFAPAEKKSEEFAVAKDNQLPDVISINPDYLETHQTGSTTEQRSDRTLLSNLVPALPPPPSGNDKDTTESTSQKEDPMDVDLEDWYFPSLSKSKSNLPVLSSLAILSHSGDVSSQEALDDAAVEFAQEYRQTAGGCSAAQGRRNMIADNSANDLFCLNEKDTDTDADAAAEEDTPEQTQDSPPKTTTAPASTTTSAETSAQTSTGLSQAQDKSTQQATGPRAEPESKHGNEPALRFPDDDPLNVHVRPDLVESNES